MSSNTPAVTPAASNLLPSEGIAQLDTDISTYKALAGNAKVHVDTLIATTPFSLATKEKYEAYREKFNQRKKEFNEKRSRFTRGFTAITAECTAIEKLYDELLKTLADQELKWKREEDARQKKEKEDQVAHAKKQEAIDRFMPTVHLRIKDWSQEAKLQYVEELELLLEDPTHNTLDPEFSDKVWQQICGIVVTELNAAQYRDDIIKEVVAPNKAKVLTDAQKDLEDFKLLAKKQATTKEGIKALKETLGVVFAHEEQEAKEAVEQAKLQAEVNTAVAASSAPSSGFVPIKKKWTCTPKTTTEFQVVLNFFIQNMIKEDGEEAALAYMLKNFSSAVTLATRAKAKGITLESVTYTEDVV
jgi:hypothetical protein